MPASAVATSLTSAGPRFCKTSIASFTSRLLPTACPSGSSILVMTATVSFPAPFPIATIRLASSRLSFRSLINAPLPVVTSSTILSLPTASFLLIIEAAIKGILSTVAVTSRSAYKSLSAGARFPVWPMTLSPFVLTASKKSFWLRSMRKPGIDSSLSSVPPVKPSPLPLIFATGTPQAATTGPRTSVILSPTPPVECLSTMIPGIGERSTTSPESRITSVRVVSSLSFIP